MSKEVLKGSLATLSYKQLFQLFIVYLLGYTMFNDNGNQCHVRWMANLKDVVMGNLDWGTTTFSSLLR